MLWAGGIICTREGDRVVIMKQIIVPCGQGGKISSPSDIRGVGSLVRLLYQIRPNPWCGWLRRSQERVR